MTSYTTRNANTTSAERYRNTAGQNQAGILDKIIGKTETKIGELKKNPRMQVEGVIRASEGNIAARNLREADAAGKTTITSIQNNYALSPSHRKTNSPTEILKNTSDPTSTDKVVGKTEKQLDELMSNHKMQVEGAICASESKRAAEDFKDESNRGTTALTSEHNASSYGKGNNTTHETSNLSENLPHSSRLPRATSGSHKTSHTVGGVHDPSHTSLLTGGSHDNSRTASSDKAVGKTEEKVGELKKNAKLEQERTARATVEKPNAEQFKFEFDSPMKSLHSSFIPGGPSSEYHTPSEGYGYTGFFPTTSVSQNVSHHAGAGEDIDTKGQDLL